jgi:hypothetical protein
MIDRCGSVNLAARDHAKLDERAVGGSQLPRPELV